MGKTHFRFLLTCFWTFPPLFFILVGMNMVTSVEIRRLSVPRWVQNGTEDFIVLDCEYVYNENDFRLVVKWFFEENLEPVYQWIPELNVRHTSGVLRGKLDLDFSVNTVDAYSRFRALRISRPSTELSGKYTCLVTSLAGQDSRQQIMTVFAPANEFDLFYTEMSYDLVNLSCEAQGLFPMPVLRLYLRPSSSSPPQLVTDVKIVPKPKSSGAFDIHLQRTFRVSDLAKNDATVFECILEIPGTNYAKTKRIAYFPGIQRQRIDAPHGLATSMSPEPSARIWAWNFIRSFGVWLLMFRFPLL